MYSTKKRKLNNNNKSQVIVKDSILLLIYNELKKLNSNVDKLDNKVNELNVKVEILSEENAGKVGGVIHCFTGNSEELAAILQFGAMVSFTGIVTFGNARQLSQDAATVPIDRIMVETDSPYLTPEPHRKHRPNEPRFVPFVAEHLASQRGMKADIFVAKVDANAERFFGLEA